MNDELKRLIKDRNFAEDELCRREEELAALGDEPESEDDPNYEHWYRVYDECNELVNEASYLSSWVESYDEDTDL